MRLVLFTLAASLAAATPALAQSGEGRVEVHTGLGWNDSQAVQGNIGAAVGYDIHTGGGTFVGLEESVDKVLTSQNRVRFGTTARFGAHIDPKDKVYGLAGYSYGEGPNATHIGAGLEHSIGPAFTKVEYRHYFTEDGARDSNAALVGVGVHF
ncbi:MAG TPA: outer membrane beta-barrel protein [Novosphingobium sp.]|nr:outer membrane beta-barrel protein [Novosphingobium sp.]